MDDGHVIQQPGIHVRLVAVTQEYLGAAADLRQDSPKQGKLPIELGALPQVFVPVLPLVRQDCLENCGEREPHFIFNFFGTLQLFGFVGLKDVKIGVEVFHDEEHIVGAFFAVVKLKLEEIAPSECLHLEGDFLGFPHVLEDAGSADYLIEGIVHHRQRRFEWKFHTGQRGTPKGQARVAWVRNLYDGRFELVRQLVSDVEGRLEGIIGVEDGLKKGDQE